MATFCTACGQPLSPEVKFCGQCGARTDLVAGTPNPAIATPRCKTCGVGALRLEKRYHLPTLRLSQLDTSL